MHNKMVVVLKTVCFIFFILLLACNKDDTPTGPQFNTLEEEIDHLVNTYTEVGAAVGIINKQKEQQLFFYGTRSLNDNDPPNGNTIFQIGSITKTFTSLLLADMVLNSTVELEDTVQSYLPANEVTLPSMGGVEILLKHLATHSSGIPKEPQGSNYPYPLNYDPTNSYAAYTKEHMYDYFTNYCALLATPGTAYSYSNIGMGLLGHTLGIIDGSNYEDLVTREIFNPLGLNSTSLFVFEEQDTNLAIGYSANFEVRKDFDAHDIFQGAGFIKSSLNDMLTYLKVNMGLIANSLEDAIALTQQPHFNIGNVTYDDRPGEIFELTIGLGWHKHKNSEGLTYFWHGGRTQGHTAYIAFDEQKLTGVVILCNYTEVPIIIFGDEVLRAIQRY